MSSDTAEFSMPEFKCSYCDYKSNKIKQFELHLKTHKFKKQKLACSNCNQLFWYAGNLQKHRERKCREIGAQRGPQAFSDQTSPEVSETKFQPFPLSEFDSANRNLIKMLVNSPAFPTFRNLNAAPLHHAAVSVSQPAGQTLLDFLNSSRAPRKYKYEAYIQSLKDLGTLQKPLEPFNADARGLATPVTQPDSLLESFKTDPLLTMPEESIENLQTTDLNDICIQNLLGSTSVQSLEWLNANPTPQPAAQDALEEDIIRPKKKKHPWECLDCVIGFKDEAMYIVHRLTHLDNNPFKCASCGKQFYDRYSFTSHIYLQGHEEIKI
ncbi:hypothetical protein CRE_21382 [Caenorhabditis remanei]|uniref:C2H2-type domain-containing protein n=1 Tax=Caenorhabditis remanei TaxID=31234 RepID=E3MUN1_CAERE|nr:hypothetical protein CRE_21382 [Caenorhabditis remanei]